MVKRPRKLAAIDGTGGEGRTAPRPRSGLILALYDTIEALGGATLAQVKEYLPAAIVNYKQVVTEDKLAKGLYNGVYRGYFIHNPNDRYYIAPLSYYEARRTIIKEIEAHTKRGSKPKRGKNTAYEFQQPTFARPFWHWPTVVAIGAVSFAIGLVVGVLLP